MDNYKNIELKKIGSTEIKNTFSWLLDPVFRKLFLMQDEPVWEKHIAYFEKVKNDLTQRVYAIYAGENHIGNCGFKYIKNKTGELWIYIGDGNYRGRHLAKPACNELITKGKQELGINKIFLHVAKTNYVAIGLYESLGFRLSEMNNEDVEIWGDIIDTIFKYELSLEETTKVAIMQPTFLPWQGFFELIINSDKFIFLDDFQFCPRSHHTRNKLFVAKNNVDFYSVNIKKHKNQDIKLNEVELSEDNKWKKDILKRISFVYSKAEFYQHYYPVVEKWLLADYKYLADINIAGIKMFCDILSIKKDFMYSSDYTKETGSTSVRTKRIIDLTKWANADEYLCAFGSFDYMKEDGYDYKKYPVVFQNYIPKPYKQIHSQEFVPYLSILDALFNIGGEETLKLIQNGTKNWLTWNERDKFSI